MSTSNTVGDPPSVIPDKAAPSTATAAWNRIGELCYRVLSARAQDLTDSTARRSALIVAPHPDDESFGCGATIMRKRAAGTRVTVCTVSDGGALPVEGMSRAEIVSVRYDNLREACRRLGIPDEDLVLLGYPDGELSQLVDPLADELAAMFSELRPDEVYIPSKIDWHDDHIAVHKASFEAGARSGSAAALYTYPVWFWRADAWAKARAPSIRRRLSSLGILAASGIGLSPRKVVTDGYLEAKRQLMDLYALELEPDDNFFEKWYLRGEELFFATDFRSRRRA